MDKFALVRFPDESLSVVSVGLIEGYDPVGKHNSKTWPHFNGPTQKGNWAKVLWPDQDKKGRAVGSTKKIAAQVVKFSPVRSDLEGLLSSMLPGDDTDDRPSGTAKKAVKRKGDLLEERILRRLRQELDQRVPSTSGTAVVAVGCGSMEPEEADERVKAAEAKAAAAEAKAAAAEAKATAAEENAAESISEMRVLQQQLQERLDEAEARAVYALGTLYPLLQVAVGCGSMEPEEADERVKAAEAKAAAAEAKATAAEENAAESISEMRVLQQQLQERLDEAEASAVYDLGTLYPLLQDLPTIVESLRSSGAASAAIVEALKSSGAAGAAATCSTEPFGRSCKFGSVLIPAMRMVCLENCQPSVYTQELAVMVFGLDVLSKSCLKGSSVGEGKEPLQKDAVDDIIVHVMSKFPALTETAVRAFLRRKCNNAATALKKDAAKHEEREQSQQRESTN